MRAFVLSLVPALALGACLSVEDFPARPDGAADTQSSDDTAGADSQVVGDATASDATAADTTLTDATATDATVVEDTTVATDTSVADTTVIEDTGPPCQGAQYNGLAIGQACDGVGACGVGVVQCKAAGDVATCSTNPDGTASQATVELCDALDNDCDGSTDENFRAGPANSVTLTGAAYPADNGKTLDDACGTGACGAGAVACAPGKTKLVCVTPTAPAASEHCDSADDDCDGQTDEGFDVGASCTVGTGGCAQTGQKICAGSGTATNCSVSGKAAGTTCDDGAACTKDDKCTGGATSKCQGTSYTCSGTCRSCDGMGGCNIASNSCYLNNACYPDGAVNPANPCQVCDPSTPTAWSDDDGRACDDGAACTVGDTCLAGVCTPGSGVLDQDADGQPGVACGGKDCDDRDAAVYDGAPEICDGVANDCSKPDALEPCVDKDADGYCAEASGPNAACVSGGGDCNDLNPFARPGMRTACAHLYLPFGTTPFEPMAAFFDGTGAFQTLTSGAAGAVLRYAGYDATGIVKRIDLGGMIATSLMAVAPETLTEAGAPSTRYYFAYQQETGTLVVGRAIGGTIEALRVVAQPPSTGGVGSAQSGPALAIDAAGRLHVAYFLQQTYALRHAIFSPALRLISDELIRFVTTTTEYVARDGLRVEADGTVRLATATYGASNQVLRLNTRSPTTQAWTYSELAAGNSTDVGATYDAQGHLHLCALGGADWKSIIYVTDASGSLQAQTLPGTPTDAAYANCLVRVSSTGNVHIIWRLQNQAIWTARKGAAVGSSWSNARLSAGLGDEGFFDARFAPDDTLWLAIGNRWLAKFKSLGWQIGSRLTPRPCSFNTDDVVTSWATTSDGTLHGLAGGLYSSGQPCHVSVAQAPGTPAVVSNVAGAYIGGNSSLIDLVATPNDQLVATYPTSSAELATIVRDPSSGIWSDVPERIALGSGVGSDVTQLRNLVTDDSAFFAAWLTGDLVLHVARATSPTKARVEETLDGAGPVHLLNAYNAGFALAGHATPYLAACTSNGLTLYTRGAGSWSHVVVDTDPCISVHLSTDAFGKAQLTWMRSDYQTDRYAFFENGVLVSYELPVSFGEAPIVLGSLPAPAALIGASLYLVAEEPGFFSPPQFIAPFAYGPEGGEVFGTLELGHRRGGLVLVAPPPPP